MTFELFPLVTFDSPILLFVRFILLWLAHAQIGLHLAHSYPILCFARYVGQIAVLESLSDPLAQHCHLVEVLGRFGIDFGDWGVEICIGMTVDDLKFTINILKLKNLR